MELIDNIFSIIQQEKYETLDNIFKEYVKGATEYLNVDEKDASNLLKLVDIEMQRAVLRYPNNEDDGPNYNPEHEEKYDDVMLGIYEKTYYYIQSEFSKLGE